MSDKIIPAILPGSLEELRAKLMRVRGAARTIQIDVCDGFFVTARTWPFHRGEREGFDRMVKGDEGLPFWEDFNFEADLMVQEPEKMLPEWIAAGISRAVIHIESKHDMATCRRNAGDLMELGIALNIETPLARVAEYIPGIDYVQLMGIATIGRQGEPFDERVLARIAELKSLYPGVTIQIDGGVNRMSAPRVAKAGADRLIAGSAILRNEDPKEAVKELSSFFP